MKKILTILAVSLTLDSLSPLDVQAARQRRRREDPASGEVKEREVSAQEVEDITDDSTIVDDPDELAKNEILQEWDNHMKDFVPDDMLTVEL